MSFKQLSLLKNIETAKHEIERLQGILEGLLTVKRAADGNQPLLSNQGQALDGYSELANYRAILKKLEK